MTIYEKIVKDNMGEAYEQLLQLLNENHEKQMRGKAGGAVMCICGAGAGGTSECAMVKYLMSMFGRVDFR